MCLRGGEEHKKLCRPGFNPQINVTFDDQGHKCLMYVEDAVTKTRKGGMLTKEGHDPKVVYVYPNIDQSRCVVRYYEKYCELLPVGGKHEELYLYERKELLSGLWFCDACIGINPLRCTVKKILEMAGFTNGNFRNHSLRSTCCTILYDARKDEQLIKEISGHRSNAVRNYKKTSSNLRRDLSECLQTMSKEIEKKTVKEEVEVTKEVNRKVCHEFKGKRGAYHICEMINKMQEVNKAKRIKLELEFSD